MIYVIMPMFSPIPPHAPRLGHRSKERQTPLFCYVKPTPDKQDGEEGMIQIIHEHVDYAPLERENPSDVEFPPVERSREASEERRFLEAVVARFGGRRGVEEDVPTRHGKVQPDDFDDMIQGEGQP